MVLVQRSLAEQLKQQTEHFFKVLEDGDTDALWNDLITLDAVEVVSTTTIPLLMQQSGVIDAYLGAEAPQVQAGAPTVLEPEHFAFSFQADTQRMRSEMLKGFMASVHEYYSQNYVPEQLMVFSRSDLDAAVVSGSGRGKDVVVLFVMGEDGRFYIDLVGMLVFAVFISAEQLYHVGMAALEGVYEGGECGSMPGWRRDDTRPT